MEREPKNLHRGAEANPEQINKISTLQSELLGEQKKYKMHVDHASDGQKIGGGFEYKGRGKDADLVSISRNNIRKIESKIRDYAKQIGADPKEFLEIDRQNEKMKELLAKFQGSQKKLNKAGNINYQSSIQKEKDEYEMSKQEYLQIATDIYDLAENMFEDPKRFLDENTYLMVKSSPEIKKAA